MAKPPRSSKNTAIKWDPETFKWAGGAEDFIKMLGASPLARQPMTDAAKAMDRFMHSGRKMVETMGEFLVHESTLHEEHEKAIERLSEEWLLESGKNEGSTTEWYKLGRREAAQNADGTYPECLHGKLE